MNQKFYIPLILLLLIMPNSVGISHPLQEPVIGEQSNAALSPSSLVCSPAPLGISFGRTSGWKFQQCESKTVSTSWGIPFNNINTISQPIWEIWWPLDGKWNSVSSS